MNIVLISTYDLGRQPFGLASPTAWLEARGHRVTPVDLTLSPLPSLVIREADLVAFFLPMHTATRLAVPVIDRVKRLNGNARLAAYGLYAPLNETYLNELGVHHVFGGEFEPGLAALAGGAAPTQPIALDRLTFLTPSRASLPALSRYAKLHINGECPESAAVALVHAAASARRLRLARAELAEAKLVRAQ